MSLHFTPTAIIFLLNTVFALGFMVVVLLDKRQRQQTYISGWWEFAGLLAAIGVWTLARGLQALTEVRSTHIFYAKFEYLAIIFVIAFWLLFALEYSQHAAWIRQPKMAWIWIVPAFTILLAFTNEWHSLFWSQVVPITTGDQFNHFNYQYGPGFWLGLAYCDILVFTSCYLLIHTVLDFPRRYRLQIGVLIAGTLLPLLAHMLYFAGFRLLPGLDLTPLGFTLAALVYWLSITRYKLFDIVPIAREAILSHMRTGVLVLDTQDRIISVNPAAERLLGLPASWLTGKKVDTTLPKGTELLKASAQSETPSEIHWDEPPSDLEVTVSPLKDRRGNPTGRLIVLRDITERKRTDQVLAQGAREMSALYETSLAINSQPDLPSLLNTITERAASLLSAPMGALYLVRPDEGILEMVVSNHLSHDFTGTKIKLGEGISGRAAQTGEAMMIEDYLQWSDKAGPFADLYLRRVLAIPLKTQGNVIGVIDILDDQIATPFTSEEIRLVNLFADQAAIAVENARLLAETTRHADRLAMLNRIGVAITMGLDMQTVLQTLLEQCQLIAPVDCFYVSLYDQATELITVPFYYESGEISPGLPRDIQQDPGLTGIVIQSRKTLSLPDTFDSQFLPKTGIIHPGGRTIRSYIGLPLILRDKVVGVLSIQSYQPNAYTQDQRQIIEMIAIQAAIAIENARLYSEVQRLSIVDELTGVYNYRGLLELGSREVERARRFRRSLVAFFFDIDDFRNFNNRYSHTIGNLVLRAVAQRSRANVRMVDLVARYGGEEFVILLPEVSVSSAVQIAERLRVDIEHHRVVTEHGELGVTVSVGVAELGDRAPNLTALLDRANQAEHAAKAAGKNTVML